MITLSGTVMPIEIEVFDLAEAAAVSEVCLKPAFLFRPPMILGLGANL
ncbi:hypothetical protein [Methylobacterium mesophilicum]